MPRPKRCEVKTCRAEFIKQRMGQRVCSPACAYALVQQNKAKAAKQRTSQAKKRYNEADRGWWLDYRKTYSTAWWLHKYIRLRDALWHLDRPCISCDIAWGAKMSAGHFRSVGAMPALRLHPLNIHGQCNRCNTHLSGNGVKYSAGLRRKIGINKLEFLEGDHPAAKFSLDELRARRDMWKALCKQIEGKEPQPPEETEAWRLNAVA